MGHILGLSGKLQSGKTTTVNGLYALEFNQQNFKARLNDQGKLLVVTDPETNEEGVFDIDSKREDIKSFLEETVHPFIKSYNLADPLKEFCIYVLGLSYESVYGTNDDKNKPTQIKWSQMPGVFTIDYGTKNKTIEKQVGCKYHPDNFMTGREILEYVGTEICRRIKDDCWTQFTIQRIQSEQPVLAIISDIRFINEVKAIQGVGGKVIRLTRTIDDGNTHKSNMELDNFDGFDAIIDNQNMSITEQMDAIMDTLLSFGFYKQL